MSYFVNENKNLYLVTFILLLLGCSAVTPHENFRDHINGEIGKSTDNAPDYSFRHEKKVINSKSLPNGNIEKEYKYLRSCRYFFEINPKTHIIVGARFEGKESDCVVAP
jgi:hypothetical protein